MPKRSLSHPFTEDANYLYYDRNDFARLIEPIDDCDGGGDDGGDDGGGGGTGGGTTTCDRETNSENDYINKAMFKDYGTLRQVEKWVSGNPEVRLFVTFAKSNVNPNFIFSGKDFAMGEKDWFKRKWFNEWTIIKNFDYLVVQWDPDIYGDRMYYSWIEEDPSLFNIDLDINVNAAFNFLNIQVANVNAVGTAELSIGSADDVIVSPVEVLFCDDTDGEGTEYPGPMIFWVNQQ